MVKGKWSRRPSEQERRDRQDLRSPVKIHCSVLAEDAIKAAIADYRRSDD